MTRAIAVAADHAGYELKQALQSVLRDRGWEIVDLGTNDSTSCDYPDMAHAAAAKVHDGTVELALLVCGTGVGMSMAANRHVGIRAVVCSEPFSARLARQHNDANILCLGARVLGTGLAMDIVDAFLGATFEGGRHARRVAKIEWNGDEPPRSIAEQGRPPQSESR